MKEKSVIIVVLLCMFICNTNAQSDINISNYWNENRYYINSAYINKDYLAELSVVGRQQWSGFPGAPKSCFATARMYWEDFKSQLGLKFFTEKHGYTSISNVTLSYTYNVALNSRWDLRFALGGSYQNLSYDFSKINVANTEELLFIYERTPKQHYYNADFGVEIVGENLALGASTKNMISLFSNKNDDKYQNLLINSNYAYAMYKMNKNGIVDFSFGVLANQYEKMFRGEFNTTIHFKLDQDIENFQVGLFFRTTEEIGLIAGINILPNLHTAYSYDYNFGNIRKAAVGTHEILLVYRINSNKTCRNCW